MSCEQTDTTLASMIVNPLHMALSVGIQPEPWLQVKQVPLALTRQQRQ